MRVCALEGCQSSLEGKRRDARYCSNACRTKGRRGRQEVQSQVEGGVATPQGIPSSLTVSWPAGGGEGGASVGVEGSAKEAGALQRLGTEGGGIAVAVLRRELEELRKRLQELSVAGERQGQTLASKVAERLTPQLEQAYRSIGAAMDRERDWVRQEVRTLRRGLQSLQGGRRGGGGHALEASALVEGRIGALEAELYELRAEVAELNEVGRAVVDLKETLGELDERVDGLQICSLRMLGINVDDEDEEEGDLS